MKLRMAAAGVAVTAVTLTGGVASSALMAAPAQAATISVTWGSIVVAGGTFSVTGIAIQNGQLVVTGTFSETILGQTTTVTGVALPVVISASGSLSAGYKLTTAPTVVVVNGVATTIPGLNVTIPSPTALATAALNGLIAAGTTVVKDAQAVAAKAAALAAALGPVAKAVATAAYDAAVATYNASVTALNNVLVTVEKLIPVKVVITIG